jgi:hypothetical protein
LFSHSTCAVFLLCGLYILKSSQLLSGSHFCLNLLLLLLLLTDLCKLIAEANQFCGLVTALSLSNILYFIIYVKM